jgi:protein-tyrosine phosphatase
MRGFVDLHCHFIAGVDDGARNPEEGIALLERLHAAGFDWVIATPHMRPGLFDNDKASLEAAYARLLPALARPGLPKTSLSSEHYFDDLVFGRIRSGLGLPYPGGRAILLEFYEVEFPLAVDRCFAELRQAGLLPVIAHPERYRGLWQSLAPLERLVDAGAAALLDVAALDGKYGDRPRRTAEKILDRDLYHAACSDAHRPEDVARVLRGMAWIEERYGGEEVEFLFGDGPRALLEGRVDE